MRLNRDFTFGVEIEGGSNYSYDDCLNDAKNIGWDLHEDGSIVDVEEPIEFVSPPYERSDFKQFIKHTKIVLQDINDSNSSCGYHIHIKFKSPLTASFLMDWDFIDYFQNQYRTNFKLSTRLKTHYCREYINRETFEDELKQQLDFQDYESRYRCINFHSFHNHRTIEFRVFSHIKSLKDVTLKTKWLFKTLDKYIKSKKFVKIQKIHSLDVEIPKTKKTKKQTILQEKDLIKEKGKVTDDYYDGFEYIISGTEEAERVEQQRIREQTTETNSRLIRRAGEEQMENDGRIEAERLWEQTRTQAISNSLRALDRNVDSLRALDRNGDRLVGREEDRE